VKNPVKRIIAAKIERNPKMNDMISLLDLDFRLKATRIGMMGRMHGDSMEIIPVKKETKYNISI
jgi:hypothetical protein